MGFNLRVSLHLAGILLTMVLMAWCLLETRYYATLLTLALALMFQVASLLRFLHRTNRELARFLTAIRYADFSQSFTPPGGTASFRQLGEAFEGIMRRFREERGDREEQAAFLQAFVQQMPIAVFALAEDGRIPLANQCFRRLIGAPGAVAHLDQVRGLEPALAHFIDSLPPGGDHGFRLARDSGPRQLKLSCSLLRSRGRRLKLVTIQDIQGELEGRELEAWQNLIRVMTHEIMNSITPVTSLAGTARQLLREAEEQLVQVDRGAKVTELLTDAADAVTTIEGRSQGMLRFVESYRRLSRLPAPRIRAFAASQLLQSVAQLMQEQARERNVHILCHCLPPRLQLQADPELLEQALINLLRNALEAVEDVPDPVVELRVEQQGRGRAALSVRDNGAGIPPELLDKIFIPFFTTKRGGSGIGMSMVRQIARLHGGSVRVNSATGKGTSVVIVL